MLAMFMLLLLVAHVEADTYYVNGRVNRCETGKNPETTQLKTIQEGIECLQSHDTLQIKGGEYYEPLNCPTVTREATQAMLDTHTYWHRAQMAVEPTLKTAPADHKDLLRGYLQLLRARVDRAVVALAKLELYCEQQTQTAAPEEKQ